MSIPESKLIVYAAVLLLLIAPLVLWGALYLITQRRSIETGKLVQRIRQVRRIAYASGIVLLLLYLMIGRFSHSAWYAIAVLSFSAGLSFPEAWLKKRMAA